MQTFQLQMLPPSGTVITPGGQVTQVVRVTNPNKVSIIFTLQVLNMLKCGF